MKTARDILGLLKLEDGRKWIEAALPFQLEDALAVLEGERPYNFLTRSRGSSKTTDLGAVALAVLLAATGRLRCFWMAADSDQGALAIDVIAGYVARTPSLADRVEIQARKVLVKDTGATLEILAADAPGAWGLNPHAIFCDEIANWGDTTSAKRLWEAVSSAAAKRKDARMVLLTTASTPDHWSFKVLEHARTSPLWRCSERPGPPPWMDEDRLAEQRTRLPESVFLQLFQNEWVQAEGTFFDPAVIAAAFTQDGPLLHRHRPNGDLVPGPFRASLDLGAVNDASVFSMGHREGDLLVLDRMMAWQGSRRRPVDFAEVEGFILALHEKFGFELRFDSWQALDVAQRLRARGVKAEEYVFSQASKQRLAQTLLATINNGGWALYEPGGLEDELVRLRLVQTRSGVWAFDHTRGGHDDRAIALALLGVALLELPSVDYSNWGRHPEGSLPGAPGRSKWADIMGMGHDAPRNNPNLERIVPQGMGGAAINPGSSPQEDDTADFTTYNPSRWGGIY